MQNPSCLFNHSASCPPQSLRLSLKLPVIQHLTQLSSRSFLVPPKDALLYCYMVNTVSLFCVTSIPALLLLLLLFPTLHNHGLSCYHPFALPFLSLQELQKGQRHARHSAKTTSHLCWVKSKSQMEGKVCKGSKRSREYADSCRHRYSLYLWILYWQQ